MIAIDILTRLNHPDKQTRLNNLREEVKNTIFPEVDARYINNHIHTTYSFSPYSPTAAAYAARAEGLCTAGIIDHDSIAGAEEFLAACEILDFPATVGMEARVSMKGTALETLRTNNPDQIGVSYMTFQSVPKEGIAILQEFFAPYREKRNERTKKMVSSINELMKDVGISIDFDKDVYPLSEAKDGGGITERHLSFALAKAMIDKAGKGQNIIDMLESCGISLSDKQKNQMLDMDYFFYEYDLLGILKGAFIEKIFIPATDECPPLADVVAIAKKADCYLCYAYLGDITDSVTGDKKSQTFEDGYLDLVLETMKNEGVNAVTYMPARNTIEQLIRVREKCEKLGMVQISGEDINSPRQSFKCAAMENPLFANLIDTTWHLIKHEQGIEPLILILI